MSDTRKVHPDYASDVDEMILDYLLYATARSFEGAWEDQTPKQHNTVHGKAYTDQLAMLDSFISIYKQNHGGLNFTSPISVNLDLKIRLLQINIRLAPLAPSDRILRTRLMNAQDRSTNQSRNNLICLLPTFLFISISVADIVGQNPSPAWMHLAAEFMLQASIAYIEDLPPESRTETSISENSVDIKQFFDWGNHEPRTPLSAGPDDELSLEELELVNQLFQDISSLQPPKYDSPQSDSSADYTSEWTNIRTHYLSRVTREADSLPSPHLESLYHDFPLDKFIVRIIDFLLSLWTVLGSPVLVELEKGELSSLGLGKGETGELIKRVGLEVKEYASGEDGDDRSALIGFANIAS